MSIHQKIYKNSVYSYMKAPKYIKKHNRAEGTLIISTPLSPGKRGCKCPKLIKISKSFLKVATLKNSKPQEHTEKKGTES